MFTIEIKINGVMIGHIYGVNIGGKEHGKNSYSYEYYKPESREVNKGLVRHAREDGIEKLIALILEDAK